MRQTAAKLTRRMALRASGAFALASLAPATARAQGSPAVIAATKLTVTGYFQTPAFIVARRKGWFARENLDVEFHLVRLAPEHNQGLAEGRWPITLSSADTMLARTTQDGVDFMIFMQPEQGIDVQLVARPGFKALVELRGKLFAADPVDSNYDLVRNLIMLRNGVRESEYRIDILGNSAARAAAFEAGKVDAAMLQGGFSEKALANGGVLLADGADYIPDWPIVCGWGLRNWLETNRATVVRFTRAMAGASEWLLRPENREETIRLVMSEEKLSRARAEKNYGFVVSRCAIRPDAIAKNLALRVELGYYKPPHRPASAFFDTSYWTEATRAG